MPRILNMVTIPLSARAFLRGQLAYFRSRGYDVHVAASGAPREDLEQVAADQGVKAHIVPFEREISLKRDIASLWAAWQLVRQLRPVVTNVGTPKAGLVGGLAARLAGVPARVYTLHGLRLETTTGTRRRLLMAMERMACANAHRVICVSPSLRQRAIDLGLVNAHKAIVLGSGTSNGLDAARFVTPHVDEIVGLRTRLNLPVDALTIGFVGRFVRDKGIRELFEAFTTLHGENPSTRLLLVGDYEEGDPLPEALRHALEAHPGVVKAGFVRDTAPYYHMMDVLALPTYREGFPTAPLEAGAAGRPAVVSDATGATDAVINNVTGVRVPVGNVEALTAALRSLLEDPERSRTMGRRSQERVLNEFQPQQMWVALEGVYQDILRERAVRRQDVLKRTLDVTVAGVGLLALSPVLLLTALLVRVKLGGPVLFRQQRPGRYGRPFTMYKFRTMLESTDAQGRFLPDAERLTPFGRLLRSSSLDELPELYNVLRGDMSLVGPRPLLMEYLEHYSPTQARRHEVRPGITGWAQVNGRNAISWEEKFALDVWYVDHRSPRLDLEILWRTLRKVLIRDGISAAGEATMPKFQGSPPDSA